ncbi:MAG: beta-hydroxyacyl-ACP dehydratase [Planctomycetaceae bacterium]|nr:beta-hydroxyacyl-ACP dehydratase [Planctomycetaceae bacterium]
MRWIWIDRFVEFESGKRAVALKNVTLAEDHLHDHFPGWPVMPNSLITEGLAQTGGLLIGESFDFEKKVVLARIPKAAYHFAVRPGDQLHYTTEVEYVHEDGSMVRATSRVGDRVQAEMEIVYGHIGAGTSAPELSEQKSFVFTMKLLGIFDVGRGANGARAIEPPGLIRFQEKVA